MPSSLPASKTTRRWYRSLYWRIALGFVLFLAVTLAAQAGLFLWLLSRYYDEIPGGSTAEFARRTSEQITTALVRDPAASLSRVIADVDTRRGPPFFVLMRDGRLAGS